jgi:hypothetical protein
MAVTSDATQHLGFAFQAAHAGLDMGAPLPLPEATALSQEPLMPAVPPEGPAAAPLATAPITGQTREAPPDAPEGTGAAAPQVHAPPRRKARQGTSAFDKLFDEAVLYGAHEERGTRKRAAAHAAPPPAAAAPVARPRAAGGARPARLASAEPPPADLPVVEMMAERIKAGGRMRAPPGLAQPRRRQAAQEASEAHPIQGGGGEAGEVPSPQHQRDAVRRGEEVHQRQLPLPGGVVESGCHVKCFWLQEACARPQRRTRPGPGQRAQQPRFQDAWHRAAPWVRAGEGISGQGEEACRGGKTANQHALLA